MDYETMQQNHDAMTDYMKETHGTQFKTKQVKGTVDGMMRGSSNGMTLGHNHVMGSGNMGM